MTDAKPEPQAGGAVLPVVGYMIQPAMASAYFHPKKEDPAYCLTCKPLTYRDDAQATIDALRAELAGAYDLLHLTEDKLAALKARVDALMRRAEVYADRCHLYRRRATAETHYDMDAAREALRAALMSNAAPEVDRSAKRVDPKGDGC